MPRVIHFEIPADNPDRAVKFYSEVFGWKFQKWAGPMEYWLITTGPDGQPGINGGLQRRSSPASSIVNTVDVASIEQSIATVESKGGKTMMPKTPIRGVGYVAYCQDPEGNLFGMMQADPSVK
jgi:uncharacterized protein